MVPAHAGAGISENAVMSTDPDLVEQAKQLLETLRAKLSVVTAESCTAGMLATLLAETLGAAEHLHGGFVTYPKAAVRRTNKTSLLGNQPLLSAPSGGISPCIRIQDHKARQAIRIKERRPGSHSGSSRR
jgi:Competence-damaged protein